MPPPVSLDEERALILEMKSQCAEEQAIFRFSDVTFLRFLRGRKHVTENAVKALKRHAKWRLDENVADIKEDEIANELLLGKIQVHGTDKIGNTEQAYK